MKIDKLAIFLIGITFLFVIGAVYIVSALTQTAAVEASADIKIATDKTSHDWGDIGINNGKVSAIFEITNNGAETLKLYNVETSCTCTTAKITLNDKKSPTYSMHTKSDYVMEVPPGDTAQVEAVYDPLFHGPTGVGQITRSVNLSTNSTSQPVLNFTLIANVTK